MDSRASEIDDELIKKLSDKIKIQPSSQRILSSFFELMS